MSEATCDSCGKTWKVPSATKAYTCKDCGGQVCTSVICTGCKAPNPTDSVFCEQCGESLFVELLDEPAAAQPDVDRRLANIELGRLKKTIFAVRAFYLVNTFVAGIKTSVFFLLFLFGAPEVPALLVGFTASVFAVSLVGTIRLRQEPFIWSVAIAAFWTIDVIISVASGVVTFWTVVFGILCAGLWVSVSRAARAQKLLEEHPDLSLEPADRSARHQYTDVGKARLRKQAKKKRSELMVLGGIVGVVFICALLIGLFVTAPPSVEESSTSFEKFWRQNDTVAIGNLYDPDYRARGVRDLKRILRQRGWTSKPPALGDGVVADYKGKTDTVSVTYRIGNGELVTIWRRSDDKGWLLRDIDVEGFAVGDGPESAIAQFKDAWSKADLDRLKRCFAEDQKAKASRLIDSVFNRPGWRDHPPAIRDESIGEARNSRVRVQFTMPDFVMSCTWEYRSPFWKLVKIRIPKQ